MNRLIFYSISFLCVSIMFCGVVNNASAGWTQLPYKVFSQEGNGPKAIEYSPTLGTYIAVAINSSTFITLDQGTSYLCDNPWSGNNSLIKAFKPESVRPEQGMPYAFLNYVGARRVEYAKDKEGNLYIACDINKLGPVDPGGYEGHVLQTSVHVFKRYGTGSYNLQDYDENPKYPYSLQNDNSSLFPTDDGRTIYQVLGECFSPKIIKDMVIAADTSSGHDEVWLFWVETDLNEGTNTLRAKRITQLQNNIPVLYRNEDRDGTILTSNVYPGFWVYSRGHVIDAATDSQGKIHLIWIEGNNGGDVKSGVFDSDSVFVNNIQTIESDYGGEVAICSDGNSSANNPHLFAAWRYGEGYALHAADWNTQQGWSNITTIASGGGFQSDIAYAQNGSCIIFWESSGEIKCAWWKPNVQELDPDILIADGSLSGNSPNVSKENYDARICTKPGTNSGEIYAIWSGVLSDAENSPTRIVGRHSGIPAFGNPAHTYYAIAGYQYYDQSLHAASSPVKVGYIGPNMGDRENAELKFYTGQFNSQHPHNQVYASRLYVSLNSNHLGVPPEDPRMGFCWVNGTYVIDPNNPITSGDISVGAVTYWDTASGTLFDTSNSYNYWSERPNLFEYLYLAEDGEPDNSPTVYATYNVGASWIEISKYINWSGN